MSDSKSNYVKYKILALQLPIENKKITRPKQTSERVTSQQLGFLLSR